MVLPPRQILVQLLGSGDFFLWQYYGEGPFGRIQAWIFRSRIHVLVKLLRRLHLNPDPILDVGCGPMFMSYALIANTNNEYIGVDIMVARRLRAYKEAIRNAGIRKIEVVRASAQSLPFQNSIFNLVLAFDVLEHLSKPREAALEIYRVVKGGKFVAISLPLENLLQKLSRIGFILMKVWGNFFFKEVARIPLTRMPEYHYVGDVKSYRLMVKMLVDLFSPLLTRYTPIGFLRSMNVNAVHLLQRKQRAAIKRSRVQLA